MRPGVSHVHHPGNELAPASSGFVDHSAAAPPTQTHPAAGPKTDVPTEKADNSFNHAALACITCKCHSIVSVGPMTETISLDSHTLVFISRCIKMMSNFSILNHTCKVASNFMPCCLCFLWPTSCRVHLINHQECIHILLERSTHKQPAN